MAILSFHAKWPGAKHTELFNSYVNGSVIELFNPYVNFSEKLSLNKSEIISNNIKKN